MQTTSSAAVLMLATTAATDTLRKGRKPTARPTSVAVDDGAGVGGAAGSAGAAAAGPSPLTRGATTVVMYRNRNEEPATLSRQHQAIDEAVRLGAIAEEDAEAMRQAIATSRTFESPPPAYDDAARRSSHAPLAGAVMTAGVADVARHGSVSVVDETRGYVLDVPGESMNSMATSQVSRRTPSRARPQRRKVLQSSQISLQKSAMSLSTDAAILHDPSVRKQIAEMKTYRPWFITLLCLVLIGYFVYPIVLSNGFAPISSNILIGPSRLSIIRAGAKYMPCMRQMTEEEFAFFSVTYGRRPASSLVPRSRCLDA